MTSELEQARDHARKMAEWVDPRETSGLLNAYCDERRIGKIAVIPPAHARCWSAVCCCDCHPRDPGPSPADRALWTQLADEIDAHLAAATSDDDQLTIGD